MISKNIALAWSDAHQYSPAPRHRRRIVLKLLAGVCYDSCLDAGCAQPYLLASLSKAHKQCYGCDISDGIIEVNRRLLPEVTFAEVDISKATFPGHKTFDVVISCEVLEHIDDWRAALKNLVSMARKYILITVPSGKIYPIDEMVGHRRHFEGPELAAELDNCGMRIVRMKRWGWPVHSLYKYAINKFAAPQLYKEFAQSRYGCIQRIVSDCLHVIFFGNDLFNKGSQLFILAERKGG
jgi:SAM-dependent methyltransferase